MVLGKEREEEGPYKKEDFTEAVLKRVIFNPKLYEDALNLLQKDRCLSIDLQNQERIYGEKLILEALRMSTFVELQVRQQQAEEANA